MKCPKCPGRLEVRNVYRAGDSAETRDLQCPCCGFRSSSITFLVPRPQQRRRGRGGRALAIAIEEGDIEPPAVGQ